MRAADEIEFTHVPRTSQRVDTQLSPMHPKLVHRDELHRTIGSPNQKLPPSSMKKCTVDSTSFTRYEMDDRKWPICPSLTHHSESARTIRRRLQQSGLSAIRLSLGLPLTQNRRRLRRQWCDERRMWMAEWNEVVFTDESCICLQHHDGWIRVWIRRGVMMLNSFVMHRHTGPAPGIMVWDGIGYHPRTPLARIADTLNSQRYISDVLDPVVLPYLHGLAKAIFQQDNA
ncbi:transposable element Tcb1 transposase [Trichonephila clavipes]|nr:transposable element Tcb1 transposase [Trichonephila clavipes]